MKKSLIFPLIILILFSFSNLFSQKNAVNPFEAIHQKLMQDRKQPSGNAADAFSGIIKPASHGQKPSGVFIDQLSIDDLKKYNTFFKGDSLYGFNFNQAKEEITSNGFKLLGEFQSVMFRKQLSFVNAKYNIVSNPAKESSQAASKIISPGNQVFASSCNNIDFEDGNLASWTFTSGYNNNSNGPLVTAGPGFTITDQNIYSCFDINLITGAYGNDPIGFPGVDPNGGSYSARVGGFYINTSSGYGFGCPGSHWWNPGPSNGEILEKTIAVTNANSLLSFDYAVILNDGGHTNGNQPYFHVFVKDLAGNVLSACTQYYVQAPAGAPPAGFVNSGYVNTFDNSIVYYKNWTSNSINLTPYIGSNVKISFVAAGCTAGAHPGYAYVDAICGSAVIAVSNASPCVGNTVILTAPVVAGGAYSWAGPGVAGLTTQTVAVTSTGNYSVTVTPSQGAGCAYTLTQTVTFGLLPVVSAAPASSLSCTNLSTQITITSNTLPASYITTGPSVTAGSTTSLVTVNAGGIYNYTVTNANNGCSTSSNVAVIQNTSTATVNAAVSNSLNCIAGTATITISSNSAAVTYSTTGPGIAAGATSSVVTVNAGGTYNYSVTNNINGCITAGSIAVVQNTTPVTATATPAASLNCTTLSTQISINTNTVPLTYTTSGPGVTGGSTSSLVSVNLGGVYSYTATNSFNGCAVSGTVSVIQNTSVVSVTATPSGSLSCSALSATISLTTNSAGVSYTAAGPGVTAGSTTSLVSVNLGGTYNYTVTNSINGCKTTGSVSVVQNTTAPTATATPASSLNCTVLTTTITITTNTAPVSYTTTGPGVQAGSSSSIITVNAGGVYNYTVTNPFNGCTVSSGTSVIQSTVAPVPSITNSPTITCLNPTVTINGSPGAGVSYTWTTGGGNIVGSPNNQSVSVNAAGVYSLAATSSSNGCVSSSPATINITANTASPAITMGANQTLPCNPASVQITSTVSPGTATLSWAGPNVCAGANASVATACANGVYTLTATNPVNGCSATNTLNVNPAVGLTVSIANTGTITCSTTTLQVIVTASPASNTYSWTGPGIIGGAGTSTITVNQGGSYSVIVTNTNGCTSNISNMVTANNATINPNATVTNSVNCTNSSATLSAAPTPTAGPYSYTWAAGGATTSAIAVSPTVSTVYTVTVFNPSNNCFATQTINVLANTNAPTSVSVTPNNVMLTCASPTAVLTATATGAASYSWVAGGGGAIIGVPSTTAGILGAGTYSVFAVGANGCLSAAQVATVTPDINAPTFTLSNSSPSITCIGAPVVTVVITSSVPIQSYSWSPITNTTNIGTFTLAGTYTCVITATNGCTTNAYVTVNSATSSPAMIAGTGTAQPLSCTNSVVTISPSFSPSANLSYTWTGPGIVGSPNNNSVQVNQSGSYSLTVTNTLTGCSTTSIVIPVSGSNVAPTLTVVPSTTIGIGCSPATSTVSLDAQSGAVVTYSWNTGASTQSITAITAGVYTVTVTDNNSCSTTATVSVLNSSVVPNFTASASGNLPCGSGTAALTANSTNPNISYAWNGAGIISGSNTANATVNQPGTYTVTALDNLTGCSAISTVNVSQANVGALAVADVTVGPAPLTVNFNNLSTGANTYSWTFGDGNTSTQVNPSNTYTNVGTYTVFLASTNGSCSGSDTLIIKVIQNLGAVPEIFTPNGDGKNDIFEIIGLDSYPKNSLQVFNRWGSAVYNSAPYKNDWDATANASGKTGSGKLPSGTYFYILNLGDDSNTVIRGFIQIQY